MGHLGNLQMLMRSVCKGGLALAFALLLANSRAAYAGPLLLSDVKAGGVSATAAFANIKGIDAASGGNPLTALLNDGGSGTFYDNNAPFTISSTGMFSTLADMTHGTTALGELTWTFLGKSDDASGGPFTGNVSGATGTLTLDNAVSGNVAISLKANNGFSVFAFQGLSNVTEFTFDTQSITKSNGRAGFGLSHASLWVSTPVPEPMTMAVLGFGFVGLVGARRRVKRSSAV